MVGAVSTKSEFEETLQKAHTMLVFKIESQLYALSIEHVAQIIPMLRLTPMPQVDQIIEGVANIHGAVVPVINARRYLGLTYVEPGLYTPVILMRVGERLIGLIVDEVEDVLTVPGRQVVSPKDILPEGIGNSPVMSGVVYRQDQSILLLEPRQMLRPTQVRALNQAMADLREAAAAARPASEKGDLAGLKDVLTANAGLLPGANQGVTSGPEKPSEAPTAVIPSQPEAGAAQASRKPVKKKRKLNPPLAGQTPDHNEEGVEASPEC